MSMSDPNSYAGAGLLTKFLGGLFGIAVVASFTGFLVLWPKTIKEAMLRAAATVIGSVMLGPFIAVAAWLRWPEMYVAGIQFAEKIGAGGWAPFVGIGMVATPFICMAGLPFWWLLGAAVLWLERRRDKDLGQLAADAKADAKAVL